MVMLIFCSFPSLSVVSVKSVTVGGPSEECRDWRHVPLPRTLCLPPVLLSCLVSAWRHDRWRWAPPLPFMAPAGLLLHLI